MKKLILIIAYFISIALSSQISTQISGSMRKPVTPPYPVCGFDFADACSKNLNIFWPNNTIVKGTTNSLTATLQWQNPTTLQWQNITVQNIVATFGGSNCWRFYGIVTKKGNYRLISTNIIQNGIAKPNVNFSYGFIQVAEADNANFKITQQKGLNSYLNTNYQTSNSPLRICKDELFNADFSIDAVQTLYNLVHPNGYYDIGHNITLRIEDPNGIVLEEPNFENYFNLITITPSFKLKIFQKGQGIFFADQASQMIDDYFNQIGGTGNGTFKLTVSLENGCDAALSKTASMYINISENEKSYDFTFNTNQKAISTSYGQASAQALTVFSSCNTGLSLGFNGIGKMLQGNYQIDLISMDNTGAPNPSNILWKGKTNTSIDGNLPASLLYSNILNATGGNLLNAIQTNTALQGTTMFIRVLVIETCDGQKTGSTEQYYKVKFNAPATSLSFRMDIGSSGGNFPGGSGKNIFNTLTTSTSPFYNNVGPYVNGAFPSGTDRLPSTNPAQPNSTGTTSGFIALSNTSGALEILNMKMEEVNSSGNVLANVFNFPNVDLLNSNLNLGNFLLNDPSSEYAVWTPPYSDNYFATNANTTLANKIFKITTTISSSCPNVTPVTKIAYINFKGKMIAGVWQSNAVATRSANVINSPFENSLIVFEQNGILSINATFADRSTFAYSLFDLTGKKLNNTLDKVQEYEAGQHYFEYNTSELTQGIYVLKTIVNGEVQSQKIQLNR